MAQSEEYKTVVSCEKQLEIALRATDRPLVHFLCVKGFITQEVHDDVLDARSKLNSHQKARKLVTGIRDRVKLSAQCYHTLLNHLHQGGRQYVAIVCILDQEYSRLGQG